MRINDIAGKTLKQVLYRLNDVWAAIFTTSRKTTISNTDYVLIKNSNTNTFSLSTANEFANYTIGLGSQVGQDQLLREWTEGNSWPQQ